MKLIDKNQVLISKEELLKIRNIISNYSSIIRTLNSYLEDNQDEYVISIFLARSIAEELDNKVTFVEKYILTGVNDSLENELREKINQFRNTDITKDNIEVLNNLIPLVSEIITIDRNIYKLKDYELFKAEVMDSLSYFCSEEVLNEIKNEYELALSKSDLSALEQLSIKTKNMILEHWKEYVTDVDSYDGGEYNFICHSTSSKKFDGEFTTKYVSCSLLCDELNDTYRAGYGFILPPEDIVAASSSDMYAINDSETEEDLFLNVSITRLNGPEKIKNDALKQKKENYEKKNDDKVYTEVVVSGFHPLAIFCLTDGSKMLDSNYTSALKLKESYPNLKIIKLDIMKNKTDKELKEIRTNLIRRIRLSLGLSFNDNEEYYDSFDMFWDKYQQLIKTDSYTEEDIIRLFKENNDLLSVFFDTDKLFEKYDLDTVKQILYYNYKFRVINIIKGNYGIAIIDRLYDNLKIYASDERLEKLVPGITTFLRIYPKLILNEDEKYKLCSFNNFSDINEFLSNILYEQAKQATFEADDTITKFFESDINLVNLMNLYDKVSDLASQNRVDSSNKEIQLFLKLYPSVQPDSEMLTDLSSKEIHTLAELNDILLDALSRKKLKIERKIEQYEERINSYENDLQEKETKKVKYSAAMECYLSQYYYSVAQADYDDIREEINGILAEIKKTESQINSKTNTLELVTIEIDALTKHKLLNKRRINSLSKEKKSISNDIKELKIKLDRLNDDLKVLRRQLRLVADAFKKEMGCSLQEYGSYLDEAKELVETTSIYSIDEEILTINGALSRLRNLLLKLKEEANIIESIEGEKKK